MEGYKPTEEQTRIIQDLGFSNFNQFATAIGVSRNNLMQYVSGKKSPTLSRSIQWAKNANTDLNTIAMLLNPDDMKGVIQE